jgi:hypothetical protein
VIGVQFGRHVGIRILPVARAPVVLNPVIPTTTAAGNAVRELTIAITVDKSTTAEPQRATVEIYNLSPLTRGLIASLATRPNGVALPSASVDTRVIRGTLVEVLAGHAGMGGGGAVFRGELSAVRSYHVGTAWITRLELGDSEAALSSAECNFTFPPATPAPFVISYCLRVLGLAIGAAPMPAALSRYVLQNGFYAGGLARDTIDAILAGVAPDLSGMPALVRVAGGIKQLWDAFTGTAPATRPLEWFVDDGLAYFVERATALPLPPVLVAAEPAPGVVRLLERPERLDGGGARIRCLLSPAFRVGGPVSIVSRELGGVYRCEAIQHRADNRTGPFETIADLRPIY